MIPDHGSVVLDDIGLLVDAPPTKIAPKVRRLAKAQLAPVAEVARQVADGVVEVTLLCQNVNAYGRDLRGDDRATFAGLLGHGVEGMEDMLERRCVVPAPTMFSSAM